MIAIFRRNALSTKRARWTMLAALVCVVVTLAVPAKTYATADGYAYWGKFRWDNVGIPSGQLYHKIKGDGYNIEWQGANFGSVTNICDPSMRFTYGNGAYELKGDVHWGCSNGGTWKYRLDWDAPHGSSCAELWAHNWKFLVARHCLYVHG